MAASAVGFAFMSFFAHVASEQVHWSLVAAARLIVGAGVAYGSARARGAAMRVADRRGIWWRSFWGTTAMLLTFFALGTPLPLGDVVTLTNLSPVFLALFAPVLLGERTGRRVVVALVLSLGGVVLIVRPEAIAGDGALAGAGAAIGAALAASFSYTMLRRMGPRESPEAVALHFSLVAAVVLTTIAAAHAALHPAAVGARATALMVGAGASGGLAQIALTRAYAIGRAAQVGSLSYLAVAISAALGALALGESPPARAIAGMALVVTGGSW